MKYIEVAPKAERDLRKVSASTLRRIARALEALAAGAPNLDVQSLSRHNPWRRFRVGSYRILLRPLSRDEVKRVTGKAGSGYLVARVVDRKEQDRAIRTLP
jgi:mRNA-degrading endonuclease RelE of RelBE toxin-antitoxin system